jgi:hypothetical protein
VSTRSRWLDWKPGEALLTESHPETPKSFKNSLGTNQQKQRKPIFAVFAGSPPVNFQNIEAGPEPPEPPASQGKSNTCGWCNQTGATSPADSPELPDSAEEKLVWMDWYEWKAAALNRLFLERGVTGEPGRITAATVRHGERTWRGR